MKAKNFLVDWVEGREVYLTSTKTGMYGRWIAEVFCDGVSVNDQLIERGFAKKYGK